MVFFQSDGTMLINVLPRRTRNLSKALKVNDGLLLVILLVQTEKRLQFSALVPTTFPRPFPWLFNRQVGCLYVNLRSFSLRSVFLRYCFQIQMQARIFHTLASHGFCGLLGRFKELVESGLVPGESSEVSTSSLSAGC